MLSNTTATAECLLLIWLFHFNDFVCLYFLLVSLMIYICLQWEKVKFDSWNCFYQLLQTRYLMTISVVTFQGSSSLVLDIIWVLKGINITWDNQQRWQGFTIRLYWDGPHGRAKKSLNFLFSWLVWLGEGMRIRVKIVLEHLGSWIFSVIYYIEYCL